MRWKRHSPEEIIAKLQVAQALIAKGASSSAAIAAIGVTDATYFRWKREYGGLTMGQIARIKQLEIENARLRRAIADLEVSSRPTAQG
jgi:putative transposase